MKTFNDLVFKPHSIKTGGVRAIMKLDNGYTISVVGGSEGLYGDGVETFEVAMFDRFNEMINLSKYDQVIGWCSKDEITEIIKKFDNKLNIDFKLNINGGE